MSQTTRCLRALATGDALASERLFELVYAELREIAAGHLRQERPGHTLQPTALVHEAYLKLIDQKKVEYQGRAHFLAVGAQAMRRILVDHARGKARERRGGGVWRRVELSEELAFSNRLDEDLLDLDAALEKLALVDQRQAQIVEMRFFGGLSVEQVALALGLTDRTIRREWSMIRAWLRRELSEGQSEGKSTDES